MNNVRNGDVVSMSDDDDDVLAIVIAIYPEKGILLVEARGERFSLLGKNARSVDPESVRVYETGFPCEDCPGEPCPACNRWNMHGRAIIKRALS